MKKVASAKNGWVKNIKEKKAPNLQIQGTVN
jgi:hypothetical protein